MFASLDQERCCPRSSLERKKDRKKDDICHPENMK